MSVEALDRKLNEIADWYSDGLKRLKIEMGARMESALSDADGVPLHLVKSSVANMLKRMEQANQEVMKD